LNHRPLWKRKLLWRAGGQLLSTETGLAFWRKFFAPIEAPVMKATGGRCRFSVGVPVVVLTTTGAP